MQPGDNAAIEPSLRQWLGVYDDIYLDYLRALEGEGVELGTPNAGEQANRELRERLRSKGALFRNGGASVSAGGISTACEACTGGAGSRTFYFSLRCHRSCFFCFNPNQDGYEHYLERDYDWRADFRELARTGRIMTHIGLTGGEPLLRPEEALAFLAEAHALWPKAHLRLYTAGDLLEEDLLAQMIESGLAEIRFSVKLDDPPAVREQVMDRIRMACGHELDVMVEMPVMPRTVDKMKDLLGELDAAGARGINLLEFCFPRGDWSEFAARGFKVKNPPFPVLYDYEYAGSCPIEGSEEACLELLEHAIDSGLSLGVHYCSLENKHRDQVFQQNHLAALDDPCYELDQEDFFYKTVKLFGEDVAPAKAVLSLFGPAEWRYDPEDGCLLVNPRHLAKLRALPVTPAISINILEQRDGAVFLRELALHVVS